MLIDVFSIKCVLRFMDGTGVTVLSEFGFKKKVAAVEPISCVMWEDLSAGVISYPVSDNKSFVLLSIPVETCGDHFLRILMDSDP